MHKCIFENLEVLLRVLEGLDLAHLIPSLDDYQQEFKEMTDKFDKPIVDILVPHLKQMKRPISLQDISKNCIRKSIGGNHFQHKLGLLPMPDLLKDVVRCDFTNSIRILPGNCMRN